MCSTTSEERDSSIVQTPLIGTDANYNTEIEYFHIGRFVEIGNRNETLIGNGQEFGTLGRLETRAQVTNLSTFHIRKRRSNIEAVLCL